MQILTSESLKAYNTLALQAQAAALVSVSSDDALLQAMEWAQTHSFPVIPLGQGSNIVFAGDINALVIQQATLGIEVISQNVSSVTLRVAAGENWHQFVAWTLQQGYFGLENLALIPGTVGAAPIQNIGAYGVELERFISAVHARDLEAGDAISLDRDDCQFSYRDSIFKNCWRDKLAITSVEFKLNLQPEVQTHYPALAQELAEQGVADASPEQVFAAVVNIRRRKLPDPAIEPNAGSFFKNPVITADKAEGLSGSFSGLPAYIQGDGRIKLPAAWLIEHCGWKGKSINGVGVHPEHSLVLVNYSADSGAALLKLASSIQESVENTFGIALEIEPRVYGQETAE